MAATRKRKSTRSPAKSKKAKAEEEPVVEESPADPPKEEEDVKPINGEETIVQVDSKDTHEAAEALLAVSGGEVKAVAEENGDGEFCFLCICLFMCTSCVLLVVGLIIFYCSFVLLIRDILKGN
jgi:hypothetical protein